MPLTLSRRSAGWGSAQAKSKHRQGCYNTPPATGASAVAPPRRLAVGPAAAGVSPVLERARLGCDGNEYSAYSPMPRALGCVQTLQAVGFASRRRAGGLRPRPGRLGVSLTAERGWARQGQASPWPLAQACRAGRCASTRSALGQPLCRLAPEPHGAFAYRVGHRGEALTPARLSRTLPAAWGPA